MGPGLKGTVRVCKALKNNKSPGIDNILNEFIKHCPNELISVIVKLFNVILDSGITPSDWTIGIIKPLYKNKGDINDINNYRGITLLSCLGKLFTSVINTRLYAYLTNENILGNEQVVGGDVRTDIFFNFYGHHLKSCPWLHN